MGFNNKDLKKINALIAIKHTMPVEVYIEKLKALKQEIINDIVVNEETHHQENENIKTVYNIIKPSIN